MYNECAVDADALGFMAKMLVQTTLPHRAQPGNQYTRTDGDVTLSITDLGGAGLPYGAYPRLILVWMTTEALRTGERKLELGRSLSSFMGQLGLQCTGGHWGTIPGLGDKWNVFSVLRSPHDGSRTKTGKETLEGQISCWLRSSISGGLRRSCQSGPWAVECHSFATILRTAYRGSSPTRFEGHQSSKEVAVITRPICLVDSARQLFEKAAANFMGIFPVEFRGWLRRNTARKVSVPGKRYRSITQSESCLPSVED